MCISMYIYIYIYIYITYIHTKHLLNIIRPTIPGKSAHLPAIPYRYSCCWCHFRVSSPCSQSSQHAHSPAATSHEYRSVIRDSVYANCDSNCECGWLMCECMNTCLYVKMWMCMCECMSLCANLSVSCEYRWICANVCGYVWMWDMCECDRVCANMWVSMCEFEWICAKTHVLYVCAHVTAKSCNVFQLQQTVIAVAVVVRANV